MEIERRVIAGGVQMRAAGDGATPKLVGYASRFNTPYEVCGFTETVAPGAFNRAISEGHDVRGLINHNADLALGRTVKPDGTPGNVTLSIDAQGLRVEMTPLDTQVWRDALVNIEAGVYSQMSIGFMTREDDWSTKDGQAFREIRDVDLLDVSVVAYPASPTTSIAVSTRALEQRDAHSNSTKVPSFGAAARGLFHHLNAEQRDKSYEEKLEALWMGLYALLGSPWPDSGPGWYVEATFDDRVIVESGFQFLAYPLTWNADGSPSFGTPTPVEIEYVPVEAAAPAEPATPSNGVQLPGTAMGAPPAEGSSTQQVNENRQRLAELL